MISQYYQNSFAPFLQQKLNQILTLPDYQEMLSLPRQIRRFSEMFGKYITREIFNKTVLSILQNSILKVSKRLKQDSHEIKTLKQTLFLYLYKQLFVEQDFQWEIQKKVAKQILWKIRLQLQFCNFMEVHEYIQNILSSLDVMNYSKEIQAKIREVLEANQFDCSKLIPIIQCEKNLQKPFVPEQNLQYLEKQEKVQIKREQFLEKRNIKVSRPKSRRRTLYMSHPIKSRQKRKDKVHVLYEYIERDQRLNGQMVDELQNQC